MFSIPRKPASLEVLECLRRRDEFSTDCLKMYRRLHQGFLGEEEFARLLDGGNFLRLFDIQLKVDGSEFQMDCLLIFQDDIYLIEVKNLQGDYRFDTDHWHALASKRTIRNPLHQLNRSEILLRQFLKNHASHLNVKSFLVFLHPRFQLYEAQLNSPIIFPGQLERFIRSLHAIPSRLNASHDKLVESLKSAHLTQSAYEQLPKYNFTDIKMGILCVNCTTMMRLSNMPRRFICPNCETCEMVDQAILRTIADFHFLFPRRPITVSSVVDWCAGVLSRNSIKYILKKHLNLHKNSRYSYYTLKE